MLVRTNVGYVVSSFESFVCTNICNDIDRIQCCKVWLGTRRPDFQTTFDATSMSIPASSNELVDSLEDYDDIVSWINDTLPQSLDNIAKASYLTELDQHITHLVATLEIACEDTSSQLERTINDVSRGVPRLTYDLNFMKDGALSLQSALANVRERSKNSVPPQTAAALDRLQVLDTMKGHMEAAREVLREAESWSSLELEVTSLLTEKSYAKAAERLSEASKSMVVFQNTPEYEPRRTLMVNLQNQLEASLSSALVAAINSQDVVVCRDYFSIFSHIQRESEFRNYYNGSRRAAIVAMWQDTRLSDCDPGNYSSSTPSQTFVQFLPTFYASFLSLLNIERTSIPAIFPDPPITLSTLITSVFSALQPSFSQRLSALFAHYGPSALEQMILVFKLTEDFAANADKIMEKIKYANIVPFSPMEGPNPSDSVHPSTPQSHARRRSIRMSMSWRSGPHRASSSGISKQTIADGLEWDQELFQPFVDFQVDYGSLERRFLEQALQDIVTSDTRENVSGSDRARLLREKAVDVISAAEECVVRCTTFTHGYAAVGLLQALDNFFHSFIDMWTAEISNTSSSSTSLVHSSTSEEDLSDLDYSPQDWSDIQTFLHLLSSARAVFDRVSIFETKLRSSLVQIMTKLRMLRSDSANFAIIGSTKGESQLLEQSTLNSAELHTLLTNVEPDATLTREASLTTSTSAAGLRHSQPTISSGATQTLLPDTRASIFSFAKACQVALQGTILYPLRKHLAAYASLPLWTTPGDPKSKRMVANDLQVPSFSLSPSDTVQRVAEGLLNLPRVFEVYADDDAFSFSLSTLPFVDAELLKGLTEQALPAPEAASQTHMRRNSLAKAPATNLDPEVVSSAWLSSLGQSLLSHLTTTILPSVQTLTIAGAAQLSSDLGYLSNIVRAINVEFEDLEKWKEYADMDDAEGRRRAVDQEGVDQTFRQVARMRGWAT